MGKERIMADNGNVKWWKKSVIYQIYPRSFCDSNGDGIGDLQGIIQKLDYLQKLGVDAIWLSPVFKSPQVDNGYDISDYRDIDSIFGTLEDMDELISKAGERGIKIIMDLVLNHSSDRHEWFVEAKKDKESPYHDYYVWRDGVEGVPPNDMESSFGGSAWEWVPELGQYYLHNFAVEQPDLNWENPKLRNELYDMINFWIKKGVGGFRLDVIDMIGKEPDKKVTVNGTHLHDYIKEMSLNTFQKADLVTVGETWGVTTELAKQFSNPDGSELSMIFQFEHIMLDQIEGKEKWDLASLDLVKLKRVFEKWQKALNGTGWNSLFWDNHDLPRIVSRWGDDGQYRIESSKMLAILLHCMQGTPYIYQGEELGMTNIKMDIGDYRDIETINMYEERMKKGFDKEEIMRSIHAKSRDNARTPMQWDDGENAGFTRGVPWLKVNPNYEVINAKSQVDDDKSVFNCYRQLISFRKKYDVFLDGDFEMLAGDDPDVFAYRRSNADSVLTVICNFHGKSVKNPVEKPAGDGELLISNYDDKNDWEVLRPYEAMAIYNNIK